MAEKMKEGLPAVEPVSADKVITLQRRLEEVALFPFYGLTVAGDTMVELVSALRSEALPGAAPDVFVQTCLNLAGKPLSRELGRDLAWRVAGNLPRLKGAPRKGIPARPVPAWTGAAERAWCLSEVTGADTTMRSFRAKGIQKGGPSGFVRKKMARVKLLILSGLPAGREIIRFWSPDYCSVAKVAFGFDRWDRAKYSSTFTKVSHTYQEPSEFFGMRIQLLIDPLKCTPEVPAFDEIYGTSSTLAFNRALTEKRARIGFSCPRKYAQSYDCFRCLAGRDECPVAVRLRTQVQGHCEMCGRPDARFDPDLPSACLDCREKHA